MNSDYKDDKVMFEIMDNLQYEKEFQELLDSTFNDISISPDDTKMIKNKINISKIKHKTKIKKNKQIKKYALIAASVFIPLTLLFNLFLNANTNENNNNIVSDNFHEADNKYNNKDVKNTHQANNKNNNIDKPSLFTNKPSPSSTNSSKESISSGYKSNKVKKIVDIPTDGVITINPGDSIPSTKGAKIVFNPGIYKGYKIVPKDGQKFYAKKGVELVGTKKDGPDKSYTEYAFWGDADDVYIGGFVIRDYNTNYQYGAIHSAIGDPNGDQAKIGQRWIVENVEVKNCVAGINIGSNSIVRNSWIHHNDVIGVKASYAINTLYDNVHVNDNGGNNPWGWGHEGGGSKFAKTRNLVVRNSYFHNNIGPGLTTSIDNYGTIYENNLIKNNTAHGIFHEISYDAIIRYNIIEGNHWEDSDGWSWSRAGIYISASQGSNDKKIEIYGNSLKNNVNGITLAPDGRRTLSDVYVHNNTLIDTGYSGVDNGGSPSENHVKLSTLTWDNNIYHGKCKWTWSTYMTWEQWLTIPNDKEGSFKP